jgi:predicted nucleic acid-binding protein
MPTLLDTSGILPFIDEKDPDHQRLVNTIRMLLRDGEELVTHNYIIVESLALVGNRYGLQMVRRVEANVVPLLTIEWVDPTLHATAMGMLLVANQRRLSLVDCVSFAVMRQRGITTAIAIDRHFEEQGFRCLP